MVTEIIPQKPRTPFQDQFRPDSPVFRGAAVAALVCSLFYFGFFGAMFRSGLGLIADILIHWTAGALAIGLLGSFHALMILIIRKLPRILGREFFTHLGLFFKTIPIPSASLIWASNLAVLLYLLIGWHFPLPFALLSGPLFISAQCLLGGTIYFILSGNYRTTGIVKKILLPVVILLLLAGDYFTITWLGSEGTAPDPPSASSYLSTGHQPFKGISPTKPGDFTVATLTYGSGTDKRRREFAGDANLKTQSVDISAIFKGHKGIRARLRKWYWGFGVTRFPINGRVWYPQGSGPFPLVLIVHGNHDMHEYSDPGYEYLAELLASRGLIAVSVDENFFNGGFAGNLKGDTSENAARGWLLLEHLKTWQTFNTGSSNPFYNKVDLDRIALIGHSRGGEAVVHAAFQNRLSRFPDDANLKLKFNFNIRSLIAIAPVDGQYRPSGKPLPLKDINYFTMQGSHDADMSVFHGNRQYQRITFSPGSHYCKASLYIHRANHGQFNTIWGRYDFSPPMSWFLNVTSLLDAQDQRTIAKIHISAFLAATLQDRREYLAIFRNHRIIGHMLPETAYINRFEDASFVPVSNFEEDINPVTATLPECSLFGEHLAVWSEDRLDFREGSSQENHVLRLGWRNHQKSSPLPPRFVIELAADTLQPNTITDAHLLVFSLADSGQEVPQQGGDNQEPSRESQADTETGENPGTGIDFTILLKDRSGSEARLPLSRFSLLRPPLQAKITKWGLMEKIIYKKSSEPVLETFEFPLAALVKSAPGFAVDDIGQIIFLFDRSSEGVIYLDDIGFRRQPSRQ